MIKITYEREADEQNLPKEVKEIARNITQTLDSEYGADRHWKEDLGGIVLILEKEADLKALTEYHLDPEELIPEYVDYVGAEEDNWLVALILLSSDYSITLIMPIYLAPLSLLNQAENEILLEPRGANHRKEEANERETMQTRGTRQHQTRERIEFPVKREEGVRPTSSSQTVR